MPTFLDSNQFSSELIFHSLLHSTCPSLRSVFISFNLLYLYIKIITLTIISIKLQHIPQYFTMIYKLNNYSPMLYTSILTEPEYS